MYKEAYQLMKRADSSWWDDVKSSVKKGWTDFNEYADKNDWVRPTIGALALGGTGFGLGSIWGRKAAIIAGLLSAATGGVTGALFNGSQKKTLDTTKKTEQKAEQPVSTPKESTQTKIPQTQQVSKPETKATAAPTQASMQQVSTKLKEGRGILSPGLAFLIHDAVPLTTMAAGYTTGGVYDNLKNFSNHLSAKNRLGITSRPVTAELRERFLRRYPETSLLKSLTRPTKGHYKSIGSASGLLLGAIPSLFAPSPYRQVQ